MYDFIVEGASIVDNDTLAARGEYAVAETPDVGSLRRGHLNGLLQSTDQTFTTDDGTPYTMSVYTPISQDVFSDPRTKLVSVFGRPCMVRIATIELSTGDARTRLVLQEIPSDGAMGAPLLLDFKLSVGRYPRYEYFDYNFDVVQSTTFDEVGNERCDLHLLVISGKRDDDDETTLVSAAQGHIFSYVRYSFTDAGDLSQRYASAMQVTPDKIHATDCPDDWSINWTCSPPNSTTRAVTRRVWALACSLPRWSMAGARKMRRC